MVKVVRVGELEAVVAFAIGVAQVVEGVSPTA